MICFFSASYFIQSFISISVDLWTVILCFVLGHGAALLIDLAQTLRSLAVGSTCTWLRVLRHARVTMGIGFFVLCLSTLFLSGARRCSRLILYVLPAPARESAVFSQEPGSHWLENGIRNQALGVRCACYCCGFVASGPSPLTVQGYTWVYTSPCTYTFA